MTTSKKTTANKKQEPIKKAEKEVLKEVKEITEQTAEEAGQIQERIHDQELAIRPQGEVIIPDAKNLWNIAAVFFKSGLFPHMKSTSGVMAGIEYGRELGLQPIMALQVLHVINGRLGIEAKGMLALFQRQGGLIVITEKTPKRCEIIFSLPGKGSHTDTFTIEDAKRAKLTGKDNWIMYPEEMNFSRCIAKGIRAYSPGTILGLYSTDELRDIDVPFGEEPKKEAPKKQAKPDPRPPARPDPEPQPRPTPEPKEEEEIIDLEPEEENGAPDTEWPPEGTVFAKEKKEAKEKLPSKHEENILFIKKELDEEKIRHQSFKIFLSLMQKELNREFVKVNEHNRLSFTLGKEGDVDLLAHHLSWSITEYKGYQKEKEANEQP